MQPVTINDDVLTLTDPVHDPSRGPGLLGRLFNPLLRDPRDLPFVRLSLLLTLIMGPAAVLLFIPGTFRWWMAPIYWGVYLWFLGPYTLMLHNTSHRPLFKRQYGLLNRYIPWVLGTLFGMSPGTYFAHHLGMHHVDGNLPADLSSTMKYQRDSFVDWLKYFLSFMTGHARLSAYYVRRGRNDMLRRFWVGEIFYLLLTVGMLAWSWQPAVVVLVFPLLMTRVMLMAGNWGQHAFVDPDDPTNDYRTVVTFINSPYNHRCFNDGYHLGHHLKPNRHWLEMPADFLDKKPEMIRQGSLVFRKLDYFQIWIMLMLKRHRALARYYVNLDPDNPLDEDQIVELFHRRLRRFEPGKLQDLQQARPMRHPQRARPAVTA
jgi:hypothetical protein